MRSTLGARYGDGKAKRRPHGGKRYAEMMKARVLFVCIHNNARSQMAEAWLEHFHGDRFVAESAGLEPTDLNPWAVLVMEEAGIDISRNRSKSVLDLLKERDDFSWIVTVCDESSSERCPVFPSQARRLHWSFPDPALLKGTLEERIDGTRFIRNQIRDRVRSWGDAFKGAPRLSGGDDDQPN